MQPLTTPASPTLGWLGQITTGESTDFSLSPPPGTPIDWDWLEDYYILPEPLPGQTYVDMEAMFVEVRRITDRPKELTDMEAIFVELRRTRQEAERMAKRQRLANKRREGRQATRRILNRPKEEDSCHHRLDLSWSTKESRTHYMTPSQHRALHCFQCDQRYAEEEEIRSQNEKEEETINDCSDDDDDDEGCTGLLYSDALLEWIFISRFTCTGPTMATWLGHER